MQNDESQNGNGNRAFKKNRNQVQVAETTNK